MKNNIISLKPFIDRMSEEEQNREAYFAEREELRRAELEQAENWRRDREINGFPGEDDIPVDDGYRYFNPDDPDCIMEAFDRLIAQQRAEEIEAGEALAVIKGLLDRYLPQEDVPAEDELEIRDPHPDEPLTVFEAVCLPELGGQLYVRKDLPGKAGPNIMVRTLRRAIERGQLTVLRPNEKNIFVTRNMIKEWLTACQEKSMNPVSLKESPATTKRASSPTKAPGSSSTEESRLRQDALSQHLKSLR